MLTNCAKIRKVVRGRETISFGSSASVYSPTVCVKLQAFTCYSSLPSVPSLPRQSSGFQLKSSFFCNYVSAEIIFSCDTTFQHSQTFSLWLHNLKTHNFISVCTANLGSRAHSSVSSISCLQRPLQAQGSIREPQLSSTSPISNINHQLTSGHSENTVITVSSLLVVGQGAGRVNGGELKPLAELALKRYFLVMAPVAAGDVLLASAVNDHDRSSVCQEPGYIAGSLESTVRSVS